MMSDLQAQLTRVDALKQRWDAVLPLPDSLREQLIADWEITHTYHSNAIEGNTLTLAETKVVLLHGITVNGKRIAEHLEAENHRDAMRLMMQLAQQNRPLLESDILELQRTVLKRIQDSDAGRYRDVRVRVSGSERIFPNPAKVPDLMHEFVVDINALEVHPAIRAARAHQGLVFIHPFKDGNGRTARLLMNLLLLKAGFPPALLPVEQRLEYYEALQQADLADPAPFDIFIARAVADTLERLLKVVE
jgi:Fic family protein